MKTPNIAASGSNDKGTALVAGASRGLGLLVATDLARRGYKVAVCSRNPDSLERGRAAIVREVPGAQVLAAPCDVTQSGAVESLINAVESELGPLEVVIHVAGIIQVGPWQATAHEHFEQAIDTMLWGPINLALACLPRMQERGRGRFGIVTSVGGKISPPRLLPYSVAKFGAVALAEGLAAELSGSGVTATAIVPGLMRTGSHLRATFFGDAAKQYAWFAPAASLPGLAMDPDRAARSMVRAVLAGRPVATVSMLSRVASLVHGLAPGLTVRGLSLVSRLLPGGDSGKAVEGAEARRTLNSPLVNRLTALGDRTAQRTNQG